MAPVLVLLLAFLIGAVSGLRSFTAPALVCWAARLNWLSVRNTHAGFMGTTAATGIFSLLALVELVADKLPFTPSRLKGAGLIARIVLGGLSGAALSVAGAQSLGLGAILGAAGGVAGAFAGHAARVGLVTSLKVPDFVIALLEDAVAIAGGLFLVSRY